MKEHDNVARWEKLFERDYIQQQIMEIADKFPDVNSVSLSQRELEAFELVDPLLEDSDEVLRIGKEVLAKTIEDNPLPDTPNISAEELSIRLNEGSVRTKIGNIRQKHAGKVVEVEGVIRRCTAPEAMVVNAKWKCLRCGFEFFVNQEAHRSLEVKNCANPNCSRDGPFNFLKKESKFVDMQRLTIQEPFDMLEGGRQEPRSIDVILKGDLIGKAWPGDRIRQVGILKLEQKTAKGGKLPVFSSYLDGLYLESEGSDYRCIEVSAEDEQSIFEESKKSDHLNRLIMSVAPSIKGNYYIKLGLLMQQVEGSTSMLPDGSVSRGSIHVLLVGDPSMGKSVLLQYISKLSPKCAMGAGGGASGVGITASVEKDRQEGWVLEAGVLPMANGGIAIVDEFDKLRDDDKAKLHEALEQGQIHVDKASVHAVLPTNCSLLAAANPKMGRFDKYESLTKQVNLAPAFLSRFDLIFLLLDRPDPSRDEEIARHILVDAHKEQPVLDQEFLRKYLAYARRFKPTLSTEASNRLTDHYTNIRKNDSDGIPILPRALHSLRRLAEASAKLRLSQIVALEDADRAIKVYSAAFDPLISNETGGLDVDIIDLGFSQLDRDRVKLLTKIIHNLSLDGGASISRINEEADKASIPQDDAMEILRRLKKAGDVMEIRPGVFTLSS